MKYSIKQLLVWIAVIGFLLATAKLWWIYWGEGKASHLEATLLALDSVEDVFVVGFWDGPLFYKVAQLHIQLSDERILIIGYPTTDLSSDFILHQIGMHRIKFSPLSADWFRRTQFGQTGDLTQLVPNCFTSVQDLIRNYHDALDNVSQWPTSKSSAMRIKGTGGGYLVWQEPTRDTF